MSDDLDDDDHVRHFGALLLQTALVVVPLHLLAVLGSILALAQALSEFEAPASGLRVLLLARAVDVLEQPAQWLLDTVGMFYPSVHPTVFLEWLLLMAVNGLLWTLALVGLQIGLVRPLQRRRAKKSRLQRLRRPHSAVVPWSH